MGSELGWHLLIVGRVGSQGTKRWGSKPRGLAAV